METDRTLLLAARKMDKDALVKIFDLYSGSLFNYALRLSGDVVLADHIVGDVFAKLLDQLAAGNGPTSNLRSYLYEMAYHRVVDESRYSGRRVPLDVTELLPQRPDSNALHMEDQVLFQQIVDAIRRTLTEDQRHVIVLRFLEGFNITETAAIMGKKEGNVKVIQNRAIAALRTALEPEERESTSLPAIHGFPNALAAD